MFTEEDVYQILGDVKDPFLHTAFKETGGIVRVSVREEKNM